MKSIVYKDEIPFSFLKDFKKEVYNHLKYGRTYFILIQHNIGTQHLMSNNTQAKHNGSLRKVEESEDFFLLDEALIVKRRI